jgi:hypothetical protein
MNQLPVYTPGCNFLLVCNFYSVKNHKIVNNSATIEARVEISTDLKSLEFDEEIGACLTKF